MCVCSWCVGDKSLTSTGAPPLPGLLHCALASWDCAPELAGASSSAPLDSACVRIWYLQARAGKRRVYPGGGERERGRVSERASKSKSKQASNVRERVSERALPCACLHRWVPLSLRCTEFIRMVYLDPRRLKKITPAWKLLLLPWPMST